MAKKKNPAKKNPIAVAFGKLVASNRTHAELAEAGRLGGIAAGETRKKLISPARRKEIASNAAKARWGKKKP